MKVYTDSHGVCLCVRVYVCACVHMTGSCREHHQHAVAADGEWFGGAETFTDSPCTADYQHSGTRRSTVQGTSTLIPHRLLICTAQMPI